ncbi:MAG: dTDP-fucosamine acetyltransferase [Chloroflexi bacterium]|nr:dTDP-fucosamine acetyltransferase [Chloroflexota bacterium]
MPEIEIRPAFSTDIPKLIELDHNYHTDHVWQMALKNSDNQKQIAFREARLPRTIRVTYPYQPEKLADTWTQRDMLLVAEGVMRLVGYIGLKKGITPQGAWITDLVVDKNLRQKGIGRALMFAAQEWCEQNGLVHLTIEMQSKNYPAIQFAYNLGFEFCGYNDQYYQNQDIALFFSIRL